MGSLPDFQVSSDMAGALVYGAIFNCHWFAGMWSASQYIFSIAYKELFPWLLFWLHIYRALNEFWGGSPPYDTMSYWWLLSNLACPFLTGGVPFILITMNLHNDQLPVGLLFWLVEHCIGIAEVMGSTPAQALMFFRLYFHYCASKSRWH